MTTTLKKIESDYEYLDFKEDIFADSDS